MHDSDQTIACLLVLMHCARGFLTACPEGQEAIAECLHNDRGQNVRDILPGCLFPAPISWGWPDARGV